MKDKKSSRLCIDCQHWLFYGDDNQMVTYCELHHWFAKDMMRTVPFLDEEGFREAASIAKKCQDYKGVE